MDPLFKEVGIYSALGQRYEPVDSDLVLSLPRGDRRPGPRGGHHRGRLDGQLPGRRHVATPRTAMPMIPFYIFYSMFGFQRTGDQMWAFGDARGRGFLMGATAGRTTLTGEGLQHDDGHTPHPRLDRPERPRLRPGLRLRARGDRPRRHRADVRARARTSSTTSRSTTRTTPSRPSPRAIDEGILRGIYRFAAAPDLGREGAPGAARRLGLDPPAGPRRAATCWPRSSASPPRSTARRRSRCCAATRSRPSAGTGSIPTPGRRASRTSRTVLGRRRRADRRRHRLDEGAARHGRALAAAVLRLARAPTASAGATRARRCGRCSRSTRRTSPRRRWSRWRAAARCRPRRPRKAIRELGIDPEKIDPLAL